MNNGFLTYEDVAAMTRTPSKPKGLSVRTIRRYVARRKLRVVRLSHSTVRFRPCDVEKDLQKLTTKTI